MDRATVLNVMQQILQKQGKSSGITEEASLQEIGFRSLDFSELALRIETATGRQLDFDAAPMRAIRNLARAFEGSIPLAKTAMRMGRKDEALLWVRREDERHRPEFIYLREDPDLLPLHDDPVFRALRNKIHSPRPEDAIAAERALEISESGVQVAAKLP